MAIFYTKKRLYKCKGKQKQRENKNKSWGKKFRGKNKD